MKLMKILVFGAGVVGSYTAHLLIKAGHDVTLVARGRRKKVIERSGLVLKHHLQLRRTVDRPTLCDRADPVVHYDLAFVAVPCDKLEGLAKVIASINAPVIVLIGNNPYPAKTLAQIRAFSKGEKEILFGYQASAGRRESASVVVERLGVGVLDVGALHSGPSDKALQRVKRAFFGTGLMIRAQEDMEAYLLCKACRLLPVAYGVYACGGDFRKTKVMQRRRIIAATAECFDLIEALGYSVLPAGEDRFYRGGVRYLFTCFMYFLMSRSVIGDLTVSDCCRVQLDEIRLIDKRFGELMAMDREQPMPNLLLLKKQMPSFARLSLKK